MQKQFLNKDTLKQFISENRLNEVVKNLIFQLNEFLDKNQNDIDYEPIRKLSDALIINSGKLNGLEHDKIIGILDRETQRITTAEVQNAILSIIDQLPIRFWNFKFVNIEISYKSQLLEGVEILHQQFSQFKYDIFICFSTKDRDLAKPIWETFRGYGLKVFVSDEDLQNTVGFNFLNKIDFALGNSQHLVLLASTNSINSVYVQDEYQSFYSDCHVKNPNLRLLIVYKLGDFQISELPRVLRTKQIATSPEQVVMTFVQENLIKHEKLQNQQQYDKHEEERIEKKQAELKGKQEQDRIEKEQTELKRNQEQDRIEKEQAELKRKQEQDRIAKEQAELKRKQEQDRIAKEQAELKRKQEQELIAKEQAELKRKQEQERIAKEQAELKRKQEQERITKEQVELKRKHEEERIAKEQSEIDIINSSKITWESPNAGYFIDIRDNNKYKVIKIGNQVWFAENFKYLPYVCTGKNRNLLADFFIGDYKKDGIWVFGYNNTDVTIAKQSEEYKKFGCLYSWYSAIDNNILPIGWDLPDEKDFKILLEYIHYSSKSLRNKSFGFNALWHERRLGNGFKNEIFSKEGIYYWAKNDEDKEWAKTLYIKTNYDNPQSIEFRKKTGFEADNDEIAEIARIRKNWGLPIRLIKR